MTERLKITYYMCTQGLRQMFWRVFLWMHSCLQEVIFSMKAGGKREILKSAVSWVTADCLSFSSLRIPCSKLICFLTEAGPAAVTTGGLCSRSRDDTEIAEGIGGQTVSQEVIYLTEVFFQETSLHRKRKCWTRAPAPLTWLCSASATSIMGAKSFLKWRGALGIYWQGDNCVQSMSFGRVVPRAEVVRNVKSLGSVKMGKRE